MEYSDIKFSENARSLMEQAKVSEKAVEELVQKSARSNSVEHFDGTAIAEGAIGEHKVRVVISEAPSEKGGTKETDALVIQTTVLS